MAEQDRPIIIRKIKRAKHAHHGGAWKIAYADFVTAMMAFFLLLWLISMTTDEQKKGLADYFAPSNISESTSGAGGVLNGTAMDASGAKTAPPVLDATQAAHTSSDDTQFGKPEVIASGRDVSLERAVDAQVASQTDINSRFDQDFHAAAASIKQAWQSNPEVSPYADRLLVERTEEGLNIVLQNDDGRAMFAPGSKFPTELARQAIAAVAPVLARLANQVEITGHTAAGGSYPNPRYGQWELSSDRANVVRGILGEFGLAETRVSAVAGRGAADPMFPNDPYLSGNERVEITVMYEEPPVPPGMKP